MAREKKLKSPYAGSHMHGMFGVGSALGVVGGLTGLPVGVVITGPGLGGTLPPVGGALTLTIPLLGRTSIAGAFTGVPTGNKVTITNNTNIALEYIV